MVIIQARSFLRHWQTRIQSEILGTTDANLRHLRCYDIFQHAHLYGISATLHAVAYITCVVFFFSRQIEEAKENADREVRAVKAEKERLDGELRELRRENSHLAEQNADVKKIQERLAVENEELKAKLKDAETKVTAEADKVNT